MPYSVVAARAGDLIRQAEWRNSADRGNPQRAIEQHGLNGGEVVMLAEAFGQAEVVPLSDFASVLREGRRLLLNVSPGHEVVITKTFQHDGAPWYEMIDSNQGPQERRFLSTTELSTILLENGVAFRPDTTIPVLR